MKLIELQLKLHLLLKFKDFHCEVNHNQKILILDSSMYFVSKFIADSQE